MDKEQLKNRIYTKFRLDKEKPIIGVMTRNNDIVRLIKQRFGNRYNIVSLYFRNKYADAYLYDLTPFEWANVFSLFDLTVTQFFHGTLLSLINLTPVISTSVIKLDRIYTGKMQDLLTRLNVPENFFIAEDIICDKATLNRFYSLAEKLIINPQKVNIKENIEKEKNFFKIFQDRFAEILDKV